MNYSEFKSKYNLTLNSKQDTAVQSGEGASLLLAVPGSGKTTVLVSRLGYLIYVLGVSPERILTMTYTVAATKDMKQRFCKLFGNEYENTLEFRTINGVCAKIIMSYERKLGAKAFELVTDEREIAESIAAIYREVEEAFASDSDIKRVRTLITYAKNMMLTREEIDSLGSTDIEFSAIYRAYNERLRQNKKMDYDDQMLYAYTILKKYPDILAYYRESYPYILVDEAQDTSKIQHEIIKLLCGEAGNLFMVGDEDQSIYGFRAAYPDALLSFEKDHKNARVFYMDDNFRSDANIVSMAQRFISSNKYRYQKHMRAVKEAKNSVRRINLASREVQYTYLYKSLCNTNKETAVLYRDNESALPLIDLFERNSIPYNAKAMDTAFFSNRVVRDIVDIISFSLDPYDTDIFMRIYYKLLSYITKENAEKACIIAKQKGIAVFNAVLSLPALTGGTQKACKALVTHFQSLLSEKPGNVIYRITNYMGYNEYLERVGVRTGKISILESIASKTRSCEELLSRLDELCVIVTEKKYDKNAFVTLSTIHSSKGLEYDKVYIIDTIDSLFPEEPILNYNNASEEEIKSYEEERRLFYVAATRAKKELSVFCYSNARSCFAEQFFCSGKEEEAAEKKEENGENELYLKYANEFKIGKILCHKHFGVGTVTGKEDSFIEVKFNIGITKRFLLKVLYENNICNLI
ncbi:MAG: ATP-dependent helicase [Ruminococcaceae bacterium]|nr:ATP-dependent helicase [Oscillospiraceae bacterium]